MTHAPALFILTEQLTAWGHKLAADTSSHRAATLMWSNATTPRFDKGQHFFPLGGTGHGRDAPPAPVQALPKPRPSFPPGHRPSSRPRQKLKIFLGERKRLFGAAPSTKWQRKWRPRPRPPHPARPLPAGTDLLRGGRRHLPPQPLRLPWAPPAGGRRGGREGGGEPRSETPLGSVRGGAWAAPCRPAMAPGGVRSRAAGCPRSEVKHSGSRLWSLE